MIIKPLTSSSFEELIQCFIKSFEGYFVKMPEDLKYWESRFEATNVDYSLSFGVYDDAKLCGFIIHGIDLIDGKLTAYNTGTGILPEYRGFQWIDKLYAHAIPILKEKGVEQCTLEVIQENAIAIRVYERIGFSIVHGLNCYNGNIERSQDPISLKITEKDALFPFRLQDYLYAWEAKSNWIIRSKKEFKTYEVKENDIRIGFFILEKSSGYLAQYELSNSDSIQNWSTLFQGIRQISKNIKLNNVNASRTALIKYLSNSGLDNVINQFEMVKNI